MDSDACDVQVTRWVHRQWDPKNNVSAGSCQQPTPIVKWDGRVLRALVNATLSIGDMTKCTDRDCRMSWYHVDALQAGESRVFEMTAGIVQLEGAEPLGEGVSFFSFLPRLFQPLKQYQSRRSVLVLVLDSASRPTVRGLAPRFFSAFQKPGSVMFPMFHSVASEHGHSEWALMFGKLPSSSLWVEEECRLARQSQPTHELQNEMLQGVSLARQFQQAGFRTALSGTAHSVVGSCLEESAWNLSAPALHTLFGGVAGREASDAQCFWGRTMLEWTLDWNLQVLEQGPAFIFSHLQGARRLRIDLGRQDEALANHVAAAVSMGAIVVAVAPQGIASPPCDVKLPFLAVANLPEAFQLSPEFNNLFSVLDLHDWLVRMSRGDYSLPHDYVPGRSIPSDHHSNSAHGQIPLTPFEQSYDLCSASPVLQARSTVEALSPPMLSPLVPHLERSNNEWSVPMAASKVNVNGSLLPFDDIFYGYDLIFEERKLYLSGSYQGVAFQQDPSDAFALADLIWRLRPDLLIELGTHQGGSAIFFADQMARYSNSAKVLTIDPKAVTIEFDTDASKLCPHCRPAHCHPLWHSSFIEFIQDESRSISTLKRVKDLSAQARRVMVIHDAMHGYHEVLADITTYAPFVTPGSYLVVQDTKLDRIRGQRGPLAASRQFLESEAGADFRMDKTFEYYLYSQHHGGFLRRVK